MNGPLRRAITIAATLTLAVLLAGIPETAAATGVPSAAGLLAEPVTILSPPVDGVFTPDGDGWDDTRTFTWQLSGPATVTVVIRDVTGGTVRSLQGKHPSGPEVTVTWDGRDDSGSLAPEGLYDVVLTTSGDGGAVTTATARTGIRLQVPGRWTAPTAGSTISGTADLIVAPTPGVDVTHVGFFVPEYSICCWDGTRAADGTWHYTFDTTLEVSGEHEGYAYLAWTDELGAKHSYLTPTVTYTIANPLRIPYTPAAQVFSPDEDGYEDSLAYYWSVSGPATTTAAVIRDGAGDTIRTLPVTADASRLYFGATWDGLDDAATPAPDGVYSMVFTAEDEHGSAAEGAARIGIRRGAPGTWTTPADGATIGGPTDLVVTPAPWATIDAARFQPPTSACCVVAGSAGSGGTWHYPFDTRTVVDGVYTSYAELEWTDEFGGIHHLYRSPTVSLTVNNTVDGVRAPRTVRAQAAPAAGLKSGEVRLAWLRPRCHGPKVVDYVVQFSVNQQFGWQTFDDGVSTRTGATVRGLTVGTSYYFRVAAVTKDGTGAWSPAVTAMPLA